VLETRCGCPAHIVVKLESDKKYRIFSMVDEHNHGFVSPDKRHLLRSNPNVSERAKSTLFNCHKASIGTSMAFRLLQVSEGGAENVGCTQRDLKNYYRACILKYTHEVFKKFQEQLVVARDHCIIQQISESEGMKIVIISSLSEKERVVQMNKSNMFGACSYKLYESYSISCGHVIQVLRGEKLIEVPSIYIMRRWEKRFKR
jgi:hypothetical protein